jgi:hypothetical protein
MRLPITLVLPLLVLGCRSVPVLPDASGGHGVAPPGDGVPLGTASPTTVTEVSPDGRWVVACQAREDTNGDGVIEVRTSPHGHPSRDEMKPYLFLGEGEGVPIDDFVSRDRTGRYLAVIRGGRLLVVEAHTGAELDLSARGADIADDGDPSRNHRAAVFDGDAGRVMWFRSDPERAIAVVRDLASGQETTFDFGPGRPWRGAVKGGWVLVGVINEDTDGNGSLTFPRILSSRAPRRCRGVEYSFSYLGQEGDSPKWYVAPASGGAARHVESLASILGDDLLVFGDDGALYREDREGERTLLVPAGGEKTPPPLADEETGLILAAVGTEPPFSLEVFGRGTHHVLGTVEKGFRNVQSAETSLVPLQSSPTLVDLEQLRLVPIPEGAEVLYLQGRRALLYRMPRLLVWDVDTGTTTPIVELDWRILLRHSLFHGPSVLFDKEVMDLATARYLGRVEGHVEALARDGRVLVPAEGPKSAPDEGLDFMEAVSREDGEIPAMGPLRWIRPAPPAAPAAETPSAE